MNGERGAATARMAVRLAALGAVLTVAAAMLVVPQVAIASPPANDNFADAAAIGPSLPVTLTGSTGDATAEAGEPDHGSWAPKSSVWFTWTAPLTGYVKVSTCGGPWRNFAVYTGDALGNLTTVVDSTYYGCSRTFGATSGTNYKIAVDNTSGASWDQTPFSLMLRVANPPPNDQFANAQPIPSAGTFGVDGDNFDATVEPGEPTLNGYNPPHKSVWYRWVAPPNVGPEAFIDACTGSGPFETIVGVYTGGSVDGLTQAPGPFAGHTSCRYPLDATPGTVYSISVDGFYDENPGFTSDEGEFTIAVDPDPIPFNDDRANAQTIGPSLPISVVGTNLNATNEPGEPDHGGVEALYSVWFRWVAPSTGPVAIDTCDSDFDSLLSVYRTAVSPLSSLGENDDSPACAGANDVGSSVNLNVTVGTTYWIAVDGWDEGSFNLAVHATGPQAFPAPSNSFSSLVHGKTLLVNVSAPGRVTVSDAAAPLRAVGSKKKRKLLLNRSSGSGNPPTISVPLSLSKLGMQRLRQQGKVTVNAKITFTPTGGTARTRTAKLKIRGK
jgi:hypothetical protein